MWLGRTSIKTTVVEGDVGILQSRKKVACCFKIGQVERISLRSEVFGVQDELRSVDAELVELENMRLGASDDKFLLKSLSKRISFRFGSIFGRGFLIEAWDAAEL